MKKSLAVLSLIAFCLVWVPNVSAAVQTISGANAGIDADGIAEGVLFDTDHTLTMADTENIGATTGVSITTDTNNQGTMLFLGDSTINGSVGSDLLRVEQITFGDGAGSADGKTVFFSGNTFAQSILFDDNNAAASSTMTVLDNVNITAPITTATNGAGTISVAGTSTFTGQVGTDAARIGLISLGGAGETTTFANDVFATLITPTAANTSVFSGGLTAGAYTFDANAATASFASGQAVDATFNSNPGVGTLIFAGGNSVATDLGAANNGVGQITVTAGTVTLAAGVDTKATSFNVNGGLLTTAGGVSDFTMLANGTFSTDILSDTSFGRVVLTAGGGTGDAIIPGTTAVDINVAGFVSNGTSFLLVDGTGGGGVATVASITDNSAILSFAQNTANTDDLIVVATRANLGTGNASAVGAAINNASASGDFATVIGQLDSLSSAADVDAALAQMDPNVNGAPNAASFNSTLRSLEALGGHLTDLRTGVWQPTGVSTGDFWADYGFWIKGYGNHSEQDARGGVRGYDADLWGVTAGFDGLVHEDVRLGFAGGYSVTDVSNAGEAGGTDVESAQGTVYMSYDDESPWYATGGFSFNWNWYDSSRDIVFGSISRTAKGDYHGQQYTAFGEIGYVIENTELEQGQVWNFIPMVGLTYSHLNIDSYTESGADSLNLTVDSQEYDLLQSSLGVRVERPWTTSIGEFLPEVHARWMYDFIGDEAATTSTFTGGGSSFSTRGADPAQHSYNAGAGITFFATENITLSGVYDFEGKEDYTSHTGKGVIRFAY